MRFEELPENWTQLPLDDAPLAAGVIDLVISGTDRRRNSLLLLPCDEYDVALPSPLVVGDTEWVQSDAERSEAMSILSQIPLPGFVIALSSAHRLEENVVREWLRTIEGELDSCDKALLAFGVVDLHSVEIVGGRAAHNGSMNAIAG